MSPREGGWLETSAPGQGPGTHCRPSSGLTWTTCKMMYIHRLKLLYSGYFSGGKMLVSSEFLASLWKNFRSHGIVCV